MKNFYLWIFCIVCISLGLIAEPGCFNFPIRRSPINEVFKIDPKQVHDLYVKHELQPTTHQETIQDNCVCPLGLLYFDETNDKLTWDKGSKVYLWAENKYGNGYKLGFWHAFDNKIKNIKRDDDDEYVNEVKAGEDNGLAVREYLEQFYQIGATPNKSE